MAWGVLLSGVLGLCGVVTFGVVNATHCGTIEPTKIRIRQIGSSLSLYAAKNKGAFPTSEQGLVAASRHFPDQLVPRDGWGNAFIYISPMPGGLPYGVISLGADGVSGGTGEDADIYSWELGR